MQVVLMFYFFFFGDDLHGVVYFLTKGFSLMKNVQINPRGCEPQGEVETRPHGFLVRPRVRSH